MQDDSVKKPQNLRKDRARTPLVLRLTNTNLKQPVSEPGNERRARKSQNPRQQDAEDDMHFRFARRKSDAEQGTNGNVRRRDWQSVPARQDHQDAGRKVCREALPVVQRRNL